MCLGELSLSLTTEVLSGHKVVKTNYHTPNMQLYILNKIF